MQIGYGQAQQIEGRGGILPLLQSKNVHIIP